jgi:predicted RNA methylase
MPIDAPAKTKPGNTRVTGKEQFYTPEYLARQLLEQVESTLGKLAGKTILEPAGGTGSFVKAAADFGVGKLVSFDIEPLHPAVAAGNFLDQELNLSEAITVSNPPFGRNNSLSIPFFNKAALYSDAICFIVPRSWRKWSVTNRLNQNFELVFDQDLSIDYVDAAGALISAKNRLATCFQIWKKTSTPRDLVWVKDMGIIEKVAHEKADVSLTIFGYGCGKLRRDFPKVKNTTQLFLKLRHPKALSALEAVDYSRFYKNTAYTEALSLQEINYLLNEKIFGDPMIEIR